MKPYLISPAVGILVGLIYGLLKVRSPAPPVIALIGLAGILVGGQVVPLTRSGPPKNPSASARYLRVEHRPLRMGLTLILECSKFRSTSEALKGTTSKLPDRYDGTVLANLHQRPPKATV